MQQPNLLVGILKSPHVVFSLLGPFKGPMGIFSGKQEVSIHDGNLLWNGNSYNELLFEPETPQTACFELENVIIGVHFHWERAENQRFLGSLLLWVEDNEVRVVNRIAVEDYLVSVISSEMNANASLSFLKAHAVISRSWVLNKLQPHLATSSEHLIETDEQRLVWYDQEAHKRFHVCADDHCQRYQGITKVYTQRAAEAVKSTYGEVLLYNNEICDARFSKCCGGAMEEFQNCWDDIPHPYLQGKRDSLTSLTLGNLAREDEARAWILSAPESFCNTQDSAILKQILPDFDQETTHFYRWKVTYTQQEIANLLRERSGIDFGNIIDLQPLKRGTSGRIVLLRIVGSHCTKIIGKELEIRRILSTSHLYSSAFIVEKREIKEGIPAQFDIFGAGWGHGVGLCQIGAAVMGAKGYTYQTILAHYYPNSQLLKIYE